MHSLESKLSANVKPTSLLVAPVILSYAKGPPSSVNGLLTPLGLPVFGEQKRLSTYGAQERRSLRLLTPKEPPLNLPLKGETL